MRAVEAALIVGVAWAVLSFGGTEPVSLAAVEILFFAVAAWLVVKPGTVSIPLKRGYFVAPVLLTAVALLQLCPLPARLLMRLAWHRASVPHGGALSVAPYETRFEVLILLACCVVFFLAMAVSSGRHHKRRLVHALVALAAGEAFYGLVQYLANWQNIFWYTKKYDLEEATGTYINRNHFAGLLEMILPFAICLALYESEKLTLSGGPRSQPVAKPNPSKTMLWLSLAIVIMAALVFSRSRMGLLATAASLIMVFGLHALRKKAAPLVATAAFVILSVSFGAWIGLRPAVSRFENLGQEFAGQEETRLSVWPGAVKLIRESPLVGNGLGSFPFAYTAFQTTFLTKFMNHAHNDYLELSADLGIPAAVALFASIWLVLFRAVRTFLRAPSRFDRNISLACVGSILAILLHSLTDFNLYIPANALVLATVLGIAVASNREASRAEAAA
jgi:O-antigen ligase